MTSYFAPIIVAFAATIFLVIVLRPLAVAMGLVDIPNERSSHQRPTPLVGGLAIYIAVTITAIGATASGLLPDQRELLSFLGGGLLLTIVGVVDDYRELSTVFRFVAQVIASLIMVFGAGVVLSDLGHMGFSGQFVDLGVFAVPFTVFATLGVINALNMCDGLDGLSGTLSLISLSGLIIAAQVHGSIDDALIMILLSASVFGFLLFNFRMPGRDHASIFLGDAGSMFLGYALTWFAISLSQGEARLITPAAALWFLLLPIVDTVTMVIRRIIRKRSPFAPDKEHIHHVFLLAGFTVNETVAIMSSAAMIGVGLGLFSMGINMPEFRIAAIFLFVGLLYAWMIMRSWKVMRFFKRSICRRRNRQDRRGNDNRRQNTENTYPDPERRSGVDRRKTARRYLIDEDNQSALGGDDDF